ncbi:TonB-dependent receptor [Pseudomaricurvus alkylphenolicus]|uniref:TonB-dependent receptor n=1 Tax=Pseudomaricurvus alkylphenolicus TaxID=1306991 RepID=UPI001420C421|nr:TonB-dependent receptor [Pseudomaricurvus alkylphenolicus]NIB40337.1 TonB-dependent receptor [Pseudomaricurvus alkylphenolicus]
MKTKKHLLSLTIACACGVYLPTALAQTEKEAKATPKRGAAQIMLEEIKVTARRKSAAEELQDVPVAVSALSSEQLEAAFVEDLTEVGAMAPNVALDPVGTVPGAASFFIRGMGVNSSVISDDPAVGVFVDGMYLGIPYGTLTDTFDLESVEVLRGPQGTLFGKNVTGGAVLLRSKRPTGEYGFKVKAAIGDYDRRDLSIAAEAPLIEDKLAAKIAILSKDHSGYFDNDATGNEVGDEKSLVIRPSATWTPTDDFTLNLIAEIGDQTLDGAPANSTIDKTGSAQVSVEEDQMLPHDFAAESDIEWKQVIAEGVWDLEQGSITTTLAWRDFEQSMGADIDGTDQPVFHFSDHSGATQDQLSFELVYAASINERLDITSGFYYFDQDVDYRESRIIFGGAVLQAANGKLEHSAMGAFIQGDYRLSDEWSLTLGGRYTREDKDALIASLGECNFEVTECTYSQNPDESWTSFTPKVGLQWRLAEEAQLYYSWTKGFRSGGFNLRNGSPTTPAGPYDQEEVQAQELGLKWDFLDGNGRLNVALYRNEFSDLQRTVLDQEARQTILNAADAVIQGGEVDFTWLLTEQLVLIASVGYTQAEYDSFEGLDVNGDGSADPEIAKDLDLVRVPEWNRSLSLTYDLPLGDAGLLTFRSAYQFTDERAGNEINSFTLDQYEVYNASVTYTSPDDSVRVSLFGKNLKNEYYAPLGFDTSLFQIEYAAPPRTWGVEVTYEY